MEEAPSPPPPPPPHSFGSNETIELCIVLPPKINSLGVWENITSPTVILRYSLPIVELQIFLTFFVTYPIYFILKPLGTTFFVAQMFAGIILGPAMLGKLETFHDILVTHELHLETVAEFGLAIFMLLMGVKMDVGQAFKTTRISVVLGIVSLVCPFVAGILVYGAFNKPNQSDSLGKERMLVVTLQPLTCFSVVAFLLHELKITNSELGRLALSSANLNTICHLIITHVMLLFQFWQASTSLAAMHVGISVIVVILLFFVFRPMMFRIIKTTPEGSRIKEVYILGIVVAAFSLGIFTHWFYGSPLFGAFLFGLAVPDGPPLGSALIDKFECFVNGVFLTIYVTTSSIHLIPKEMAFDHSTLIFSFVLSIVTFFVKLISCFIASLKSMMPWRDSLAFALIMCSQGIVELSYFHMFRDEKIMSETTFSAFTFVILVNATLIPILVKFLYDPVSRKCVGYQQRNLMHLKPDAELQILACIHKHENVPILIDLLDLVSPTKESHIVIHALYLVELMARDSPIFIAHQREENRVSSYFEHNLAFNKYEQNNYGLAIVNAYTAISPPRFMHEDINIMALDKQTSFLILPFHRKLSMDGSIDFENKVIRNLNCTILDRGPCSIGILVDRGLLDRRRKLLKSSSSSSLYSILMLYLGGKDDREALILAKRMARNPRVKLTVIHIVANQGDKNVIDWDMMLDAEILKDIKQNQVNDGCEILYIEEVSNNGPETAKIVRSVANEYDLIVVGRCYGVNTVKTKGLLEWSEFPELGVVGDLLTSTDLDSSGSVLIVKQQDYIDVT